MTSYYCTDFIICLLFQNQVKAQRPAEGGNKANGEKSKNEKTGRNVRGKTVLVREDLPSGANKDSAFDGMVIPIFLNIILGGNNPWVHLPKHIEPVLNMICPHVYGDLLSIDTHKGSLAYEIVSNLVSSNPGLLLFTMTF